MRGGTITATLLGAVVAGIAGGVLLHGSMPFPTTFAQLTSGGPPTSSSPSASSKSSPPTDGPGPTEESTADSTPTQDRDPTKEPRPTKKPSPTDTAPAFTRAALLAGADFLDHGWGKAEVLSLRDGVPDPAVTLCASVGSDVDGLRSAYAATYRGLQTNGAEQVVRFRTVSAAEDAFADLTEQVDECDTAPEPGAQATVGTRHEPELPPLTEAVWWNTGPSEGGVSARGVVGAVRVDDRIAFLTLTSTTSDPAETVEVENLLTQAGRRLV